MKRSYMIIGAVAIVALFVILIVTLGGDKKTTSKTTKSTSSNSSMNMDHTGSSTSANDATMTSKVTIKDFAFVDPEIKVMVGTTVTWTNQDSIAHTVTADVASSDAPNSELIPQGKTYSFTFNKVGTYTYHCTPHPSMKGTVTVTAN